MSWILTILGIVLLVVLHELGHFTVAKLVGMRVERFSLFFPPTLARFKLGETEYALGAIPAGGYVKITGMSPEELRGVDLRVAVHGYSMLAPWKRIAVIAAGPGVNLVIAFVLFWAILMSGSLTGSTALYKLDPATEAIQASSQVQAIERGEPAAGALREGDRILAVDGARISGEATRTRIDAHRCAGVATDGCRASTPAVLTVLRDGRTLHVTLYPRYSKASGRMLIGVQFGVVAKDFGAAQAASSAVSVMWHATTGTLTGFFKALTSSKTRHEVSSIVGITKTAHETVVAGPGVALVFLGYISLVLAVINLFPFLPLDGGHIVWSLGEKLRGRRISLAAMYRYSTVGILLLAFLVINGVSNDIGRLGG
ncbi:MAG TPA: M50 family metallopeptidase [Solirubrobacteraceae bacterium]|nr:M50 family metallopeptidase [Solirubrobacteraceae bacterium]